MKPYRYQLIVILSLLFIFHTSATVLYVDLNSANPSPPYADWSTAATNIQDAVDASMDGDLILVNSGVYNSGSTITSDGTTNRVAMTKAVTVQSVSGPAMTLIDGGQAMRCVYLTNNAALTGFTLTNGVAGSGGGMWCASTNILVSSCLMISNSANYGGGVYAGTLTNCVVTGNSAVPSGNSLNAYGGGACQSVLNNCTISGNVNNRTMGGNGSGSVGGGCAYCILNNCLIIENSASDGGGAYSSTLNNCSVANNSAQNILYSDSGILSCTANNCIIYSNTPTGNYSSSALNYCCTTQFPNSGIGNITNNPLFINPSGNDFHLQTGSVCINAGNNAYVVGGADLDGNPRIADGTVDMGAYEYQAHVPMTVVIQASGTNVVVGYPLVFSALSFDGYPTNTVWDFGDGTVVTNQLPVSHIWSALGDYSVTLTAFNGSNPGGVSATVTVQVVTQTIRYVSFLSTNASLPYTNWNTAAVSIQDAVDAAVIGDLVLVTNGTSLNTNGIGIYRTGGRVVYGSMTNRVAITKPVTVQSVNGPAVTWILGNSRIGDGAVRCVYLTNGAALIGFTLTNGATRGLGADSTNELSGGAAWCASTNAYISNCLIVSNSAYLYGGGVYSGTLSNCTLVRNSAPWGGAINSGVLNNCLLVSNSTSSYGGGSGGGAAICLLNDCTISNNTAPAGNGGGAYLCTLNNCTLTANSANNISTSMGYGGGAFGSTLYNCTLGGNTATYGGAVFGGIGNPAILNNCVMSNNMALWGGGVAGTSPLGFTNCILNNCTLSSNSARYGGGAWLAALNNCTIISNRAAATPPVGGGGGVAGGLLNNCVLTGNVVGYGTGGGADGSATAGCLLNHCTLSGNVATNSGGGASYCTLNNCTLSGNVTWASGSLTGGGGAFQSTLTGCLIVSNAAPGNVFALGIGGGTYYCTLTNCILTFNLAGTNGGGASQSRLFNCTITSNSAPLGGGVADSMADNCIVYYNSGGNYYHGILGILLSLNYCCTTPALSGTGNITNEPAFVDLASEDLHLQSNSPCINSGDNAFVALTNDFDGNVRIQGGMVDIGAYEYQTPTSVISYAWLQQYGLPTDGTADYADSDGDGLNNWQEWRAGTNPTNASSVLKMASSTPTNNPPGLVVTWQSVNTRMYFLQSSIDLGAPPGFTTIQSNIVGQAGTTSYTDITATNAGPYFYRVGVQ